MRPAILLFIALIMSACAGMDDSKKTITLDSALWKYERAIRWGEHEVADSFRKQATGTARNPAHLKPIKVTAYNVVNKIESADRTEVQIDVEISYYNEFTMKEVKITDHQLWEYDTVGKSWYITSPMPAFK